MDRLDIENEVVRRLNSRGWMRKRLHSLQPGYVRDTPVTPFFSFRVLRRGKDTYSVDGYVGVIHQEFECNWLREHPLPKKRNRYEFNRHSLVLHIANIADLCRVAWIYPSDTARQVGDFGETLLAILERLPHTELELSHAFGAGRLIDVPISKFALVGQDNKFQALTSFLATKSTVQA